MYEGERVRGNMLPDALALVHPRPEVSREVALAGEKGDRDDVAVVDECAYGDVGCVEHPREVVRFGPVMCDHQQAKNLPE